MSHSIVIVALPPGGDVRGRLAAALAPFDENAAVEPYRNYEDGEPGAYWSWNADPQIPSPTWEHVAQAHNAKYGDEKLFVDEDGRAYQMSTYNPRAKWDWYSVGGRWTGYFHVRAAWVGDANLASGRPGLMTEPNADREKCDCAPKRMLDFAAMRDWAEVDQGAQWKKFRAIADQYPDTRSWAWHVERVQDEADPMTIDQAREAYHAQSGVVALRETDFRFADDPYKNFAVTLEAYQADARLGAVPGWALLTLDGEWRERGDMGWWGMSDATDDSTAKFRRWANEYLDGLDDDVILVAVDVHI
jgi:hypothetical protein